MKLLPRLEPLTGEVFCGHHRMRSGLRSDAWCLRPANHEGSCRFGVLAYSMEDLAAPQWENKESNIKIDPKVSTSGRTTEQSMFDYLREVMPEWNWDEDEARFKYDGGGFKGPPRSTYDDR